MTYAWYQMVSQHFDGTKGIDGTQSDMINQNIFIHMIYVYESGSFY